MKKSKPKAFTLIELLVAVAIIGILAALLLPAVPNVRAKARSIQCISELKQWEIAAQFYANDNEDDLPRENGANGVNSWAVVRAGTNENVWYNAWLQAADQKPASYYADTFVPALQQDFYLASSLLACPSARFDPVLSINNPQFSRGINSRLAGGVVGSTRIKLAELTDPSFTPLMLDAGVPGERSLPGQLTYDGRPHVKWDRASARHSGFGNAAFADGSARAIPASDLVKATPETFRWER